MASEADSGTASPSQSQSSTGLTQSSNSSPTIILLPAYIRSSPPEEIFIHPPLAPYAQLCFEKEENRLVTVLIGKFASRSKYSPFFDTLPDLQSSSSSQATITEYSNASEDWASSSSSEAEPDEFANNTALMMSPREMIVFMDEAWMLDGSSQFSDPHVALLRETSATDVDDWSFTCGKLMRSVACRSRARSKPHSHGTTTSNSNNTQKDQGTSNRFGYEILNS